MMQQGGAEQLPDLSRFEVREPPPRRARAPRPAPAAAPAHAAPPSEWKLSRADRVRGWFQTTYGRELPVSAFGQSGTHDRLGYDHADAMDVALHPDSDEGRALTSYLDGEGIPYSAWRSAVPGKATAAHIHVGESSSALRGPALPDLSDFEVAGEELPDLAQFEADDETESVTAGAFIERPRTVAPPDPVTQADGANFREFRVKPPAGRRLVELSGVELAREAAMQYGASRGIPREVTEAWLGEKGRVRFFNLGDGSDASPAMLVDTPSYDSKTGEVITNAELPFFRELEARHFGEGRTFEDANAEAAERFTRSTLDSRVPRTDAPDDPARVQAGVDYWTDPHTQPGEKVLGLVAPVAEVAGQGLDYATRPLTAASSAVWGTLREGPSAGLEEASHTFRTGDTRARGKNPVGQALRESESLRSINPRLAEMAGTVADVVADPVNLVPVGAVGRGAMLLARTERGTALAAKLSRAAEGVRGLRTTALDIENAAEVIAPRVGAVESVAARPFKAPGTAKLTVRMAGGEVRDFIYDSHIGAVVDEATGEAMELPGGVAGRIESDPRTSALLQDIARGAKGAPVAEFRARAKAVGLSDRDVTALIEDARSGGPYGDAAEGKVLMHVAGPSGAGKTELMNALRDEVKNVSLVDLDMFDDSAVRELGWTKIPKDDYTDEMLAKLHEVRQAKIDRFIERSRRPIIFFGHHIEAGMETRLPARERVLMDVSPERAAVNAARRPGKTAADVLHDLSVGREDVSELTARGYQPESPRSIYSRVRALAAEGGPVSSLLTRPRSVSGAAPPAPPTVPPAAAGGASVPPVGPPPKLGPSLPRRVLDEAVAVIQLPKAIRASFDWSAVGRQGLPQVLARPGFLKKTLAEQAKATVSAVEAEEFARSIRARSDFDLLNKYVDLSTQGKIVEEPFASKYARRIPGVAASERAYNVALDSLRVQAWSLYMRDLMPRYLKGDPLVTDKTFAAVGELINISTGRGVVPILDRSRLGRSIVQGLNVPFFSPRNMAAKFNVISPRRVVANYINPETRPVAKIQLREAARGTATLSLTLGLLDLIPGVSVGMNPLRPGFGKVTVGDRTHYDLTGGVGPAVRYMAQMWSAFGDIEQGEKLEEGKTPAALTARYLRSQLSPMAAYAVDAYTGETFEGEEFSAGRDAAKLAVPFIVEDLHDAWVEAGGTSVPDMWDKARNPNLSRGTTGFSGLPSVLPAALGFGVRHYDTSHPFESQAPEPRPLDLGPVASRELARLGVKIELPERGWSVEGSTGDSRSFAGDALSMPPESRAELEAMMSEEVREAVEQAVASPDYESFETDGDRKRHVDGIVKAAAERAKSEFRRLVRERDFKETDRLRRFADSLEQRSRARRVAQ